MYSYLGFCRRNSGPRIILYTNTKRYAVCKLYLLGKSAAIGGVMAIHCSITRRCKNPKKFMCFSGAPTPRINAQSGEKLLKIGFLCGCPCRKKTRCRGYHFVSNPIFVESSNVNHRYFVYYHTADVKVQVRFLVSAVATPPLYYSFCYLGMV